MQTVAETEIVVVGGGISGSASAYELAKAGKDVILVEKGKIAGEASGRNSGGVRQAGRHPAIMHLAIEALKIWPGLEEELGYPMEFRCGGDLMAAMDDAEMEVLQKGAIRQNALGLFCQLIDASEVRAKVKGISDRIVGGLFTPSDGTANPILSTKAIAKGAEDKGAKIWIGTEVNSIEVKDGEVVAVNTSRGRVLTKHLVLVAGPWTALLGRMIGVTIPIHPSRIQLLVTETTGRMFDCFIAANGLSIRQTNSGTIHCRGGGPPREYAAGRPIVFDKMTSAMSLQRSANRLIEVLPGIADLMVLRTWGGLIEPTPDHLPVIDRLDNPSNVVVAAGFSGRGFALGPITGRLVSELILYGRTKLDISSFRLNRFDLNAPEAATFVDWFASPFGSFEGQQFVPPGTRVGDRW